MYGPPHISGSKAFVDGTLMPRFNNLPWCQLLAFNVSNTQQMQHQSPKRTTLTTRNFLSSRKKVYKQYVLHLESLSKEHMPLFAIFHI